MKSMKPMKSSHCQLNCSRRLMTKASGDKWGIVDRVVKLQTFTLKAKVPSNISAIPAALTLS